MPETYTIQHLDPPYDPQSSVEVQYAFEPPPFWRFLRFHALSAPDETGVCREGLATVWRKTEARQERHKRSLVLLLLCPRLSDVLHFIDAGN